jgi:hypothetical protein
VERRCFSANDDCCLHGGAGSGELARAEAVVPLYQANPPMESSCYGTLPPISISPRGHLGPQFWELLVLPVAEMVTQNGFSCVAVG